MRPRRRRSPLAAATTALVLVAAHRPDGVTRITVLDVGQGDAILVEGSRGGRMLVDGGPDPDRLLVELDSRLPPWDRRIDVVVLTHPHEDHVAGLAAAARAVPRRAGLRDRDARSRTRLRGLGGAPSTGRARRARGTLATGDTIGVDDLRFRVLWPDPRTRPARAAGQRARASTTSRSCCSARSAGERVPADRRRRGRRRPDPPGARPATDRLPEGRPSRQRDGVDARRCSRRSARASPSISVGDGNTVRPPAAVDDQPGCARSAQVVERTDLDGGCRGLDRRRAG